MPLESSMRFGCCGWKAGKGEIGICCQSVDWDAALGSGTHMTAAATTIATKIIERKIRFVRMFIACLFIAHLPGAAHSDLKEPDLTQAAGKELDPIPACRLVLRRWRFRSRRRCGWCPERFHR